MPKIVDHDKQKQLVAEAVWRIIRHKGLEQASVRNVAEEAGLSAGSLRHYFNTQSELLAYSMELIGGKVKARAEQHANRPLLQGIQLVIEELLPLDAERRAEMEVWFAFTAKAMSDSKLNELSVQVYEEMQGTFRIMMNELVAMNLAKPELDVELEAERLHALIDGLAVHGITHPEQMPPQRMRDIAADYVQSLLQK